MQARVIAQTYLGTHRGYCCNANGLELNVNTDALIEFVLGDEIFLHLPNERLWILET